MTNRQSFRGWIVIALAYFVAVLPIHLPNRLFWMGLVSAAAYCVLALRTTRKTVEIAQDHDEITQRYLWHKALRATLVNAVIYAPLLFLLTTVAAQFATGTPPNCPVLFRAYCMSYMNGFSYAWERVVLVAGLIALFLVLDYGLLIALVLLCRRYLIQSDMFISKTAVGLRFALACVILSITAVSVNILEFSVYRNDYMTLIPRAVTITEERVFETLYPAFEPLVTNGIFLSANILNRADHCKRTGNTYLECGGLYDTRPFIARQLFIAALSAMLYGVLIAGILRLSRADTYKAKRGLD